VIEKIKNLIQIGWKGRLIKISLEEALKNKNKKGFIILAEDSSENTKKKVINNFKEYYILFKKEEIGALLGKKEVAVVFVPYNKFGINLKNLIQSYFKQF